MINSTIRKNNLVIFLGRVCKIERIEGNPSNPILWININGAVLLKHGLEGLQPIPMVCFFNKEYGFDWISTNRISEDFLLKTDHNIWTLIVPKLYAQFNISYIHQLQNIFYVLTKRELPI